MLSKKIKTVSPSVTVGISSKVKELKANGVDVIGLSIGEPDFNVPEKAKAYGVKSLQENRTKYDLVPGVMELREEICRKLKEENSCDYTPDEIVVSSGAKNSLSNIFLSFLDPGDEVLLPLPYWVSYSESIKIVGGVPVPVKTKKENGFKLQKEELLEAITDRTKLVVITNPSNPTGSVYTREELEDIVKVCIDKKVYIVADEIYERICYVDNFVSVASLSPEAKDITITVNGFAKSAAMTGLRVGYTASNKEIAKAMNTVQSHLVSHPSLTAQYIALGALKECGEDIKHMADVYRDRCEKITARLDKIDSLSYIKPEGAFYVFIDISKYRDKIDYKDSFSIEFCERLLDEAKVALVPGLAFGLDDFVRVSYACTEEEFLGGIDRLEKFLETL